VADLVVELYGVRVGVLAGDWRTFDLVPDPRAVEAFGIDSPILSVAIPLAVAPTRAHKDRRQNFFRELLPEGRMLGWLARQARVPERDAVGLLRTHGRDVAGALQIWDPDAPGEPRQPGLEPLAPDGVAELLRRIQDFPLGNAPVTGKTSLPGVQDKIVLVRTDAGWARPLDGYPSTHIVKPAAADDPTGIYDEEYGARLARALGLAGFGTWIEDFAGTPALVVERYDRSPQAPQGRIHQEDFNQALSAGGDQKYQRFDGRVSLARIARVFATVGDTESMRRLLRMTVMAVAVGNLDMHAKNLALLHPLDSPMTLAPAYDVVPQAHRSNDGEMALAVDGEYRHRAISREHLVAEGRSWGLSDADELVDAALAGVLSAVADEVPLPGAHPGLADDITRFTTNLTSGRAAGDCSSAW
jgi:serine/threonine-protein kinase HipA